MNMVTTLNPNARYLPVLKALYFLYFAAIGSFYLFLFIYYAQIGLSGQQMGAIISIGPAVGLFAAPFWGWLSDRLNLTRPLFLFSAGGGMLLVFWLSKTESFGAILLITILMAIITSPMNTLLDSTALVLLGDRRDLYGQYRLWGSVGYIITSFIFGLITQRYGLQWIFAGYIGFIGLFLLVSFRLPIQRPKIVSTLNKGILQLLNQRSWAMFTASIIVMSISFYSILSFLGVYMVQIGGSEGLVGLVGSLGAIVEIPFLFSASGFIRRFGSRTMLIVGYLGYFGRLATYALMPSAVWAIPAVIFNGISYGFYQPSAIAYVDEITPPQWKGTSMGLYNAANSLGGIVCGVINGYLLDTVGGSKMYAINALLIFVAIGLLLLAGKTAGGPVAKTVPVSSNETM
jgi:MFS transporter, PPP family, 3-phenylpropionic acid transporter